MDNLDNIYRTAQDCIKIAVERCLQYRHSEGQQERKQDKSWVTQADKNIEREMRQLITKNHPKHFILGEEEGGEISEEGYTWVLDPIDGTFSFVHNIPFYSSLVAVLKGKTPIIGFAALPGMNVVMSAVKGQGLLINEKPYKRPSMVGQSSTEIVATSDPYRFHNENRGEIVHELYGPTKKARAYGDALAYYFLLNGSVRAFLDPKVEIWDAAPFHVILPEAGFAIHPWGQPSQGLVRGTCIAYALDSHNMPINCADVIEMAARFA